MTKGGVRTPRTPPLDPRLHNDISNLKLRKDISDFSCLKLVLPPVGAASSADEWQGSPSGGEFLIQRPDPNKDELNISTAFTNTVKSFFFLQSN